MYVYSCTQYIYTVYICISIQYTHERRNTGRTIIWYNPPFSKNVKTNIAKQFLHSLDKNYGRNHNITRSSNITMSKLVIVA